MQLCIEQDLNPRPTDRKPKCLTRCTTTECTRCHMMCSDRAGRPAGQEHSHQTSGATAGDAPRQGVYDQDSSTQGQDMA